MKREHSFGDNLRMQLFKHMVSQRELSNRTGISEPIISTYVNDRKEPKVSNLILIADALNITIDELVRGDTNGTI